MKSKPRSRLKDPRTCRVFFSSPFGGMEGEREELTRKYFPQIHHLCNSRGIQFVPVDMRWGITSEAAENAQTVNICLRELDRCDIFVGFYGQRYGWHGSEDKQLQQNFDNAVTRYPWLDEFRDRSATELEFIHGHLNNPGAMPACFCFRDKEYDADRYKDYHSQGDNKVAAKYLCENEEAKGKLDQLKDRITQTQDQTLGVFVDYKTPEEGSKRIFDTLWSHLKSVLTDVSEEISEQERELEEHDAFMASRQALYVGGEKYMEQLDNLLLSDKTEKLVVTGPAGQGKSALLANWVSHVKHSRPDVTLAYHFVGSSKESGQAENVLKRLLWEVGMRSEAPDDSSTGEDKPTNENQNSETEKTEAPSEESKPEEVNDKGKGEKEEVKDKKKEEKKMTVVELMNELISEVEGKKKPIVLLIDGIDKIETLKISKPVYWLSDKWPSHVKLVVSTLDTDQASIQELTDVRKYIRLTLTDLDLDQRTQICLRTLEKSGKALSKEQLQKVVDKDQTRNPLYLKIVMAELSVFGYFRKLDEKIDALLTANSVGEVFEKLLERLETDYNTEDHPDLVQQVLSYLYVSREGMTEPELIEILDVSSHVWSPLFFALEQFVVVHSGLIKFAFSELRDAVHQRYLLNTEDRGKAVKLLIKHFDEKRKTFTLWPKTPQSVSKHALTELAWLQKDIGDAAGLVTTLSDLSVFRSLLLHNEYDLLELWKSTGKKFSEVADIYITSFNQTLVDIYCLEKDQLYEIKDEKKPPAQRIMTTLENIRFFMDLSSSVTGQMKVIQRIIAALENLEGVYQNEKDRRELLAENRYYLACAYNDMDDLAQAEKLHLQVLQYWQDELQKGDVEVKLAETRIAWVMNGLGLNRLRDRKYKEAEDYFAQCLAYHEKHSNKRNLADTIMNRGLARLRQGHLHAAKTDMLDTLKIYEEIFFGKLPHEIGNLYTNLGLIYRRLKQLDDAEKYYFKSLEIKAKAVGMEHLIISTCYMNLGTLEMHRRCWDKAEGYTQKALDIYKLNQVGDDIMEYRNCRENMANCFLRQGKFQEAKPFYWDVFETLMRQNAMRECLPWVHNTMARHCLDSGEYKDAERIATAMALCSERRKPDTYLVLEDIYKVAPPPDPRPRETTLEFAVEQWPNNSSLLQKKIERDYFPTLDVDGLVQYLGERESPVNRYTEVFTFLSEAKPGMALALMEQILKKFPDNNDVRLLAVETFYKEKQFDKALPVVEEILHNVAVLRSSDDPVPCLRILMWAGKQEEARDLARTVRTVIPFWAQSEEFKQILIELDIPPEGQN